MSTYGLAPDLLMDRLELASPLHHHHPFQIIIGNGFIFTFFAFIQASTFDKIRSGSKLGTSVLKRILRGNCLLHVFYMSFSNIPQRIYRLILSVGFLRHKIITCNKYGINVPSQKHKNSERTILIKSKQP